MTEYPSSYPSYRFYADGRAIEVQNQAEFDALEAGHAGSYVGPFPETAAPGTEPGPELPVAVSERPPDASGLTAELAQEATRRRVRELRTAGKSQREIAEALGVSPRTVRRLLGEA
jgi:DNA-binding NarL/FixJ family response regulator